MDRALLPSRWRHWRLALAGAALLTLAGLLAWQWPAGLAVDATPLEVATVERGEFRDELGLRAQTVPARQVLLDAIEGGRVDAVLVRDGEMLKAGQLIYRLSNPQREQEVLQRGAEVAQQLSNLSLQRTALANARAQQRRDLTQLETELERTTADFKRQQQLAAQGFVSGSVLEEAERKRQQQQRLLEQARADGQAELQIREQAIDELARAVRGLQDGLAVVRQAASNLDARAPSEGQLSGFNLQLGASVRAGERLGRIDTIGDFKLTATLDEFYLARVKVGQAAWLEQAGKTWPLHISQKLPQVKDGRFGLELSFDGAQPPALQAGQSLDLRLRLGEPSQALLLRDGPFFADSGGAWVYVLDADGQHARRRTVQLGRRAAAQIEVLGGLQPGERVIVSRVRDFGEAPLLRLRH